MRPCAFDYLAPETLEEAVALLAEHAPDARVLAGGQSLIPAMNLRLARPSVVIDLGRVPDLAGIDRRGDFVTIGATTTHAEIEASPILIEALPMFPVMARRIGHPAIRNRGTFGGSLAHADPASEWPCALLALNGRIEAIGPRGERTISSDEFFHSYYTTALEPDEILTRVVLPAQDEAMRWSFHEVARQAGAFGLVLVLACATLSSDGDRRGSADCDRWMRCAPAAADRRGVRLDRFTPERRVRRGDRGTDRAGLGSTRRQPCER